ncbi:cystatin-F [Boleophthalmus pectinirostris]|uniref:cystatin-F n=1 Tax=Boleophthalmus pectinirostris TaxID=150288 RepID=UPI000A1C2E71|nr:cystatin-F [Boleophthalmus pectinirostris]
MATFLIITAILAVGVPVSRGGRCVPGAPCDVSADDRSVLQAALAAAQTYNNQSNDSFLFRPQRIIKAQRQVVKGVRFLLDLDLCRTVCRKRDKPQKNLQDCDLQPPGPLHQMFRCHVEIWVVPWSHHRVTQRLDCQSERREQSFGQSERRMMVSE